MAHKTEKFPTIENKINKQTNTLLVAITDKYVSESIIFLSTKFSALSTAVSNTIILSIIIYNLIIFLLHRNYLTISKRGINISKNLIDY